MDDYMFSAVMRDKANLKPLLECILKVKITDIDFAEPQKSEKEGYQSHGIRLDLYAQDGRERIYNVEGQTSSKRNLPKRMRYYQSVIDINILAPGVNYMNLKKSFVIFICNYDPFGKGRSIYTFENRCIEEVGLSFGDETLKVIINTKGHVEDSDADLKEIFIYLEEGKATGAYTRQLDEAVRLVKSSEERRHEYMVMMIRDMEKIEEGKEIGKEIGKILGTVETMRDDGKPDKTIVARLMSRYGLTEEEAKRYVALEAAAM